VCCKMRMMHVFIRDAAQVCMGRVKCALQLSKCQFWLLSVYVLQGYVGKNFRNISIKVRWRCLLQLANSRFDIGSARALVLPSTRPSAGVNQNLRVKCILYAVVQHCTTTRSHRCLAGPHLLSLRQQVSRRCT
jgi:hypothetical protein